MKNKHTITSIEKFQNNCDDIEQEEKIREIIVEKKAGFNLLEVVIIVIITLLFGILIGGIITYSKQEHDEKNKLASVPTELEEFVETYENILNNYYTELDKNELLDAGIEGMINYLDDPNSNYMTIDESQVFNETVDGAYTGIGAEIVLKDNQIVVASIFDGGPAFKAGLQEGDIINQIDNKDVKGMDLSTVSSLIKGKKGTSVHVSVIREQVEKDVVIIRDKVDLPSVTSQILEKNNKKVGYIKIGIFAANTAKQFKKELQTLEKKEIQSLIIDVRDNPGGHLTQVTEILSLFLSKGDILYQIETKGIKEPTYDSTKEKRKYPVSVLTNNNSASASEILASAMKEVYKSSIIGESTYGKGTIQKTFELKSGATIKYTTQKWLTPNGAWLNEKGLKPTLEVKLDDSYYDNPTIEQDNQLQTALDLLAK